MNKTLKYGGAFLLLLIVIYFLGPKPVNPKLDPKLEEFNISIEELSAYVQKRESKIPDIKVGNEAKIIWADSQGIKTPYSVVYLHGFSASQQEGDPIHREFAKRYGCNLYLARLYGHGLEADKALENLSVENYIETAKTAISIAKVLGDSVIIMSTSTGGTLALYLAAYNPEIKALICYSPNIRVKDPSAFLLNNPWGKQIAELILGSDKCTWEGNDSIQAYWSTTYTVDALVTMQNLLENTMTENTFEKVQQPVFMGYYYKNDKQQDNVVSVNAALEMYSQLGTTENKKVKVAFPNAGHHVIASRHQSGDLISVRKETYKFADSILGLSPINEK